MSDERRFVRRVLIVLGLTSLFLLAWFLRTLVLMLFGALVVATVFRAFADRICKLTGWRTGIGTAISITLIVGLSLALSPCSARMSSSRCNHCAKPFRRPGVRSKHAWVTWV